MAAKNNLIENFTKSIGSLAAATRNKKLNTIQRLAEIAAPFIAKKYGVSKLDAIAYLIAAIITSDRKYPSPAIDVLTEEGDAKTKRYIDYLWNYYKCSNNKKTVAKKTKGKLPKINNDNVPTKEEIAAAKKKEEEAAAKPRIKPTVELDLSSQIVRKNGAVTIYWTSENAVRVLDNNFGLPKKSTKTTGQLLDDKIKKRKTYWIIVENDYGDTARDEIDLELEDPDLDPLGNVINEVRQEEGQVPAGESQQNQQENQDTPIVTRTTNTRLGGDQVNKILEDIRQITADILTNLTNQSLLSKQTIAVQRREAETQRRQKREGVMETPKKLGSQLMSSSLMKPVKSLWDWLVNFITYVILGRMFVKILKWATDPQNKEKVDSLKRFLKDFGPALLGAFVLFGTSFGKFIRSLVGSVFSMSKFILKKGIPTLMSILKSLGPKGRLAAAVIVGGIAARQMVSQLYKSPDEEGAQPQAQPQQPKPKAEKDPYQFTMPQMKGGGMIKKFNNVPILDALKANVQDMMYAAGGMITENSGVDVKGAGADTQLVATQPGEVIISKKAVDYFGGPEFFLKLNQMGGGTNQPSFSNNVQLAAGGGLVGSKSAPRITNNNQTKFNPSLNLPAVNLAVGKLKHDEALSSLTKGSNDYIRPGGKSVVSGTPWAKVTGNTPLHSYLDSQGVPTIGWGATFYDSLFKGSKQVKMGDVITKTRADNVFQSQVMDLANTYSTKIKFWPQMSNEQRAGLLLTGFNAPMGPIGAYPKLTSSLEMGRMKDVATNVQRGGPSATRIQMERSLLMSGPMDLSKVKAQPAAGAAKPKEQPKPKNIIQRIGDSFNNLFRPSSSQQNQSSNILPSESIQRVPTKTPEIGPNRNSNNVAFVNLAPIVAGQQKQAQAALGTELPDFSATSFAMEERMNNASTYGVV
jgi:GH24 family phage-related lysozyme (muramidase)